MRSPQRRGAEDAEVRREKANENCDLKSLSSVTASNSWLLKMTNKKISICEFLTVTIQLRKRATVWEWLIL
jgi:hypothetical protein